jgi:hypothetical protein
LPLLEKAVKQGEASGKDLAYLTDRLLVADMKKQLYGTQFTMKDGELVPSPIEDEANVDKRRKELGMETMAEYTKALRELYKGKEGEKKWGAVPTLDRQRRTRRERLSCATGTVSWNRPREGSTGLGGDTA